MSFEEGLLRTVEWYKEVSREWWFIGTDSALAPHPNISVVA
jgi:UDP-glucose 4,6-dehydratase